MTKYQGKVNAPDFPPDLDWINTDGPLSMKQLRGKIVLLDFWTYCCINCMHIIPDLRKLEEKYASELVVVGVHSAKFVSERETENILPAVLRYEIEHPVVNDHSMAVWRQYGVRAWPTVIVVDPDGKVVGTVSGEGVFESLDPIIGQMAAEFDAAGRLDRRPFQMRPLAARMPQPLLSFPGKVLADAASGRLFIADSNHNRIIVSTLDGEVKDVIGNGEAGRRDGDFESASFNHPQGMCLSGDVLYIADTDNHALRRANLATRRVETVSGNGVQARRINPSTAEARSARLNSPWDVVAAGGAIYIAMAGPHQIWKYDISADTIGPWAGSGQEAIVDGPLAQAALAQPSGIATDGLRLYFADSETSSVRAASLQPDGRVETIVGQGLFEFGDRDGAGGEVRLQHPLGVALYDSVLYVADTYNNKIKKVVPATRGVTTFLAGFDEPGGLSGADGKLYIADTNNHMIQVADLATGKILPLALRGIEKLRRRQSARAWPGDVVEIPGITVRTGEVEVILDLSLPPQYKLNETAPNRMLLRFDDERPPVLFDRPGHFPIELKAVVTADVTLQVFGEFYYCRTDTAALCFYKELLLTIPIKVSADDVRKSQIHVQHMIESADFLP